jgi:hypothetical protein
MSLRGFHLPLVPSSRWSVCPPRPTTTSLPSIARASCAPMPSSIGSPLTSSVTPSPSPPPSAPQHQSLPPSTATASHLPVASGIGLADEALLDSGSELSELTEDESAPAPTRQQQFTHRRRRRRGGGGKRSGASMLPGGMWDWAVKKNQRANEEDDEEDDALLNVDAMDEDDNANPEAPDTATADSSQMTTPTARLVRKAAIQARGLARDALAPLDEDAARDDLSDEEDEDDGDEAAADAREAARPRPADAAGSEDDADYATDDDEVGPDDRLPTINGRNATMDDDVESQDSEDVDDNDEEEDGPTPSKVAAPDGMADIPSPTRVRPVGPAPLVIYDGVAVDVTAPTPAAAATVAAAVAGSSIMAGSGIVEPPSPSSSAASSPSPSPAPSRTLSPVRRQKPSSTAKPASTKGADKAQVDGAAIAPGSPSAAKKAQPTEDTEPADIQVDEDEADADVDLLEAELQPAHRAEALDALALIEIKFAMLRERVYVEKMEALAVEEKLIEDGTWMRCLPGDQFF